MRNDENIQKTGFMGKQITRRDAIKAGGIAAVGLAFSKPLVETIYPKPAFANYIVDMTKCTQRPVALVMRYVGGNVITQPQLDKKGNAKASVVESNGGVGTTSPVKILALGKSDGSGGTFFDGIVNLNDTFVIDSANVSGRTELHSDTRVEIYTSDSAMTLLQTIIFHTSCSKLLRLNDQFGGIQVAGWLGKDGEMVGIQP